MLSQDILNVDEAKPEGHVGVLVSRNLCKRVNGYATVLALMRLFANGNLETANHERFSRSPMTNMPSITIVTLVSNHRLKMATFLR